MASIGLIQGANSINPTQAAYEARETKLGEQHAAESKAALDAQTRRDNDMLKVFEFAGDGQVDAAKYYAKSKGLEIPEQIYSNADFAKGLALSGKLYGDDPEAAHKFTNAWMQTQGDLNTRITSAQQAAGKPVNSADRDYQRKIQFEEWKLKNLPNSGSGGDSSFTLEPGKSRIIADGTVIASMPAEPPISRYEAVQKTINSLLSSGMSSQEEIDREAKRAGELWDAAYGNNTASTGITGGMQDPMAASNNAISQRQSEIGVNPYQTQDRLPAGLPEGSVLIGTASGRPVYQTPDGRRFIDDATQTNR